MSAPGPAIIHYEVYSLESRGWILHARYRREEKEQAMTEAKLIESSLGMSAKVVRETYYPGNNVCEETIAYVSENAQRPRGGHSSSGGSRGGRGGGFSDGGFSGGGYSGSGGFSGGAAVAGRGRAMAGRGRGSVFVRLMTLTGAALAVAAAVTGIVSAIFTKLPEYGIFVGLDVESIGTFLAFVVTFLGTAVPLAARTVNWDFSAPARPRPAAAPVRYRVTKSTEEIEAELEEKRRLKEEKRRQKEEEEAARKAKEDEEKEDEAEEEDKEEDGDEEAASDHDDYMRFLNLLVGKVREVRPILDAYNLFGIDLLLAGAIDALGEERDLKSEDRVRILKEAIEAIGTKPDTAKVFAEKYEDYLVETRYIGMIQAGRTAMESFLAEDEDFSVKSLFENWNKPKGTDQAQPKIMTLMFTDMVGSTDLTQAKGDKAAQEVVRRHNAIVRAALAEFSGREIKHTGDGIMASFASAANGVEAAVVMLRRITESNVGLTDTALHVRIGINAGEPIEEEDDLFGTTVQLAARVCAKAGTDQILCTNVVRELSSGKSLAFIPQGAHPLKGFKEPISLFEVAWRPDLFPGEE